MIKWMIQNFVFLLLKHVSDELFEWLTNSRTDGISTELRTFRLSYTEQQASNVSKQLVLHRKIFPTFEKLRSFLMKRAYTDGLWSE